MRCIPNPLRRALLATLLSALCLGTLAACAGPLRTPSTPEAPATAEGSVAPTPSAAPPAAPVDSPTAAAVDCAPSEAQLEPGEPIALLSRVAGCPGLVRVEWRGTQLLVPLERLGLSEADLAGLPEEAR
jgi:hypothetical protein